eukprot:scaffold254376_cov13-Tisochrysis_lutea.AAC.1
MQNLSEILRQRGMDVEVAPITRLDWSRNAAALTDGIECWVPVHAHMLQWLTTMSELVEGHTETEACCGLVHGQTERVDAGAEHVQCLRLNPDAPLNRKSVRSKV